MSDVTRRDLLGRGSVLALGMLLGSQSLGHAEELTLEYQETQEIPQTPVTVAVIGAGEQGREILKSLSYLTGPVVKYVCDSYSSPLFQKKALENAPKATFVNDYKKVLDDKTVQGVFVATPTHLHKQIVLDALAAGKHVFCEAPLAHTIEDARAIALAGKNAKTIFQVGLHNRTNPQHHHVKDFIDSGKTMGNVARCSAQWNLKSSWRRAAPTPERESELNWRLDQTRANGLVGEVGIHQIDTATWYLKSLPLSVSGFGTGEGFLRTVTCVVQYPEGVNLTYDATLGSSFGGSFELIQGGQCAILLRGQRGWMFKESDADNLGWEVYARREQVGDETGIMLVANASKALAQGLEPAKVAQMNAKQTPNRYACETFLNSIRLGKPTGITEATKPGYNPKMYATAEAGFVATVVGIKANEAALTGNKITFSKEMFAL
ncbi:Gfo/Idh/MocA family protein [Armatimonas rosea]|uniref:Glycosyl hydrolase family 109 protein n=1 Tax=Armatimonas rosea TaxID=685828 RepID=A0A7W9SQI1_ARMRO|nr:Gfo/Idh/MocA family oxidoreductase [Armatimonas rosea]MBB6050349.1 putative dehydrogenase [Armatimonas rosea]